MSITTITIGGVEYVSYSSVAEADATLAVDATRADAWAVLTIDQKGARLVQASRRLDLLRWAGVKAGGDAQQEAFPRADLTYASGNPAPDDDVPTAVARATALLAGSIALDASAGEQGSSGSNVKSVRAGSTGVEFFRQQTGVPLADETAYALVREFLDGVGVGSGATGPAAFGTDECSVFADRGAWGRTAGFP